MTYCHSGQWVKTLPAFLAVKFSGPHSAGWWCTDTLRFMKFQVTQHQSHAIKKKKKWNKNLSSTILENRTSFSLWEWKYYDMKVADKYCWVTTKGVWWWSCCSQSGSSVLESGFKLESLVYTYMGTHKSDLSKIRILPDHPEHNDCVSQGLSLYHWFT